MSAFFVCLAAMEFYALITIKTTHEDTVSVSCWDFWIYNLRTMFSFLSVVVQLKSEKEVKKCFLQWPFFLALSMGFF